MDSLKLLFLTVTQGITELLPVSSSGHILLFGSVMNISVTTVFLTTLHIGTTLAIILFFRKTLFKNFLSKNNRIFLLKILVGSIPAIIVGVFFEDYISNKLRAPFITALSLIVWGIVMIVIDRSKKSKGIEMESITFKKSLGIGMAQAIALIPGTSRSGITAIAGILLGLDKYSALQFSFLLGIPILLGSSVWSLGKELVKGNDFLTVIGINDIWSILIMILVPLAVGYVTLMVIEKFKKKNWLTVFGIYRIVIGLAILFLQYWS